MSQQQQKKQLDTAKQHLHMYYIMYNIMYNIMHNIQYLRSIVIVSQPSDKTNQRTV